MGDSLFINAMKLEGDDDGIDECALREKLAIVEKEIQSIASRMHELQEERKHILSCLGDIEAIAIPPLDFTVHSRVFLTVSQLMPQGHVLSLMI